MNSVTVFGDSHTLCFNGVCKNVSVFYAASAKGLSNEHSFTQTNQKICTELNNIEDGSNVLFFFGKVDMDFVLNYKYDTNPEINFIDYTIDIVNSYINFIKKSAANKNVYICELPICHMNDENLLIRLNDERAIQWTNFYLSESDRCDVSTVSKVINFNDRLKYYLLFNREVARHCEENNFKFLEVNKYFMNEKGEYEIPLKYINVENVLDHHLNHNVNELFVKSYNEKCGIETNPSEFN
jgi:hypothetical protein